MSAILETASAKVNLSLKVKGKRPDGYHELESLVVFADVADRLTVCEGEGLSLELDGPFAEGLQGAVGNLILEAAKLFGDAVGRVPNLSFTLEKNLPIASGIGGGSADAAAALRLMCRLWDDPEVPLNELALMLGADVPVCLRKRPCLMSGVGEQLMLIDHLPELHAVLVNPGVAVSTRAVFSALAAPGVVDQAVESKNPHIETLERLLAWLAENENDLQAPAMAVAPVITQVLQTIEKTPGCKLARMSGSGATCFGLYDNPFDAAEAGAAIRAAQPGWWAVATRFKGV